MTLIDSQVHAYEAKAVAIQSPAAALMTYLERHASASNRSPKFRPALPGTLTGISVKAAEIWQS